jgi:hypothetical protein
VQVEVLTLSPEPGERIPENEVMIAAAFIDQGAQLDPGSIRIEVDGRDVTAESELSAEVATWRPRVPLPPGPHRVTVTARARDGRSVTPATWAFTVESAGESAARRRRAARQVGGFPCGQAAPGRRDRKPRSQRLWTI